MSTTTTLKLPEEVKRSAVNAAKKRGVTPHAFMVDAIRQAAAAAENRARFVAEAMASRKDALKSGKGFDAAEVHEYLRQKIAGGKVARPKARSWRG